MSFIEVTRRGTGAKVTVNVDHILTVSTRVGRDMYQGNDKVAGAGELYTEITLAGGSVNAPAQVMATEPYQDLRRALMGP